MSPKTVDRIIDWDSVQHTVSMDNAKCNIDMDCKNTIVASASAKGTRPCLATCHKNKRRLVRQKLDKLLRQSSVILQQSSVILQKARDLEQLSHILKEEIDVEKEVHPA